MRIESPMMDDVYFVKILCLYGKEWDNTSWFPTRKLMFGLFCLFSLYDVHY